jgi:hypothetical protein
LKKLRRVLGDRARMVAVAAPVWVAAILGVGATTAGALAAIRKTGLLVGRVRRAFHARGRLVVVAERPAARSRVPEGTLRLAEAR